MLMVLAACSPPKPSPRGPAPEPEPSVVELPVDEPRLLGSEEEIDSEIERGTWLLEHGDDDDQVRAHLSLGDAYWNRAGLLHGRLYDLLEEREGADGAEVEALQARERALHRQRQECLARAALEYRAALDATGPLARRLRARARYGLAGVLGEQGDEAAAARELAALVRDDPEHSLAMTARLSLADHAFMDQRLDDAEEIYEEVLGSTLPSERLYARYKLGWIALNRDDGQRALTEWTQVVLEGRVLPHGRTLARQAAKDCVLAFSMVGQPEQAGAFFSQLHPQMAPELLRDLVQRYRDEGRPQDAAKVLGQPVPP